MDSKDLSASKPYRGRLLRIAVRLMFAIAALGVVQWATAFRGDLLWILMGALGFVLAGVIILMLPGRILTGSELDENYKRILKQDWLDELHDNDRHIIGSRMNDI
jgi:hypothetical protein